MLKFAQRKLNKMPRKIHLCENRKHKVAEAMNVRNKCHWQPPVPLPWDSVCSWGGHTTPQWSKWTASERHTAPRQGMVRAAATAAAPGDPPAWNGGKRSPTHPKVSNHTVFT